MKNIDTRTEIFENLPVKTAVLKQILPAIASQMVALAYNLADTYFVGMLNDPRQTAAVTIVSSSFVMLTAISNLFGIGGASLIARHLGKKSPEKATQVSSAAFWSGIIGALLFSLIFTLFAKPILYLCGAAPETYHLAYEYAKWVVILGGPFAIMNTLLANLIRAEGAATAASFGVSLGGIINIILDPFFVLPSFFGLGAVGAGMATAFSNLISTTFLLLYLFKKREKTIISLNIKNLRFIKEHILRIFSIGFPSAVQLTLTVIAISAQTKFVSAYETEAIAALGIIKKLDMLPLYFSIGVSNGMLPLLAYNHSAGNHTRRSNAFRFGCFISVAFSLTCLICYEIFAPFLVGLFITDPLTETYGAVFLRIMVIAMPFMSLGYPMIVQFQAMGKVKESLICSVLRKGVIDIPLLFILDTIIPLYGCMMVQPIVDALSLAIALIFYIKINKKLRIGAIN